MEPSSLLPVASSGLLLPWDKQLEEQSCSSHIHRYTDQTCRSRGFTSSQGPRTWVARRVCSVFRTRSSPRLPSSGSDSVHRPQLKPPCGICSFTTTTPCILWEKARPVLIDPTKVGSLALDPAAICPSFSLGSWWSSSEGVFSLLLLAEAMVPLKLRTPSDRNRSKQKTCWENDIQTSGKVGGYIGESLTTKQRHRKKPGRKWAPRRPHHQVARPAGARATVWCGASGLRFLLVFISWFFIFNKNNKSISRKV
jgi:hypothetical protein